MGAISSTDSKKTVQGEPSTDFVNWNSFVNPQEPFIPPQKKITSPKDIKKKEFKCKLDARAKVLKSFCHKKLWDNFLLSAADSFALTPGEIKSLLKESRLEEDKLGTSNNTGDLKDVAQFEVDIDNLLQLIQEKTETEILSATSNKTNQPSKVIDFMALHSSIMLLSPVQIEEKIDSTFKLVELGQGERDLLLGGQPLPDNPKLDKDEFGFDEFFVAMVSFERGLAHAMGKKANSSKAVKEICKNWFSLISDASKATIGQGGKGTGGTKSSGIVAAKGPEGDDNPKILKVSKDQFFSLCTNRQQCVRRLLEALATLKISSGSDNELMSTEIAAQRDDLVRVPTGGDEWMANPAWKKTAEKMIPPAAELPACANTKPVSNLVLDWIHGYRGSDCRNNLRYVNEQGTQIGFTAAALGVVQTISTEQDKAQSYFGEHTDDIISFAVYEPVMPTAADRNRTISTLIATGEIGKQPAIHLYTWTSVLVENKCGGSFTSLACMRGYHTKGVCQLAFSGDGKMLFSVGVDYTVATYWTDVTDTANFGKMKCSSSMKGVALHLEKCGLNGCDFATCGEKHVVFWPLEKGVLKPKQASLDDKAKGNFKNKTFLCLASVQDEMVAGTGDGDIVVFKEYKVLYFFEQAHGKGKAVNALWSRGDVVLSGGKDGKILLFKKEGVESIKMLASFSVTFEGAPTVVNVRSVCMSVDSTKVLIGTQTCEIIEVTRTEPKSRFDDTNTSTAAAELLVHGRRVLNGHFAGELWGLAVRPPGESPLQSEYCTVGDDGYLRVWDVEQKKQSTCEAMGKVARCCAYSPDGSMIAVGFGKGKVPEDGMFRVYRVTRTHTPNIPDVEIKIEMVFEAKETKKWICDIKFSPDGRTLAMGAHDNSIYLYNVQQQFKRKAKFAKHNSYITHFDFSSDGKFLQSNCGAYELLFSDANTGQQISKLDALKGTEWDTWTCTLGWPVIGTWTGGMDGTDINAVSRSPSGKLIATADDFGKLRLFSYPCTVEGTPFASYTGHSSFVQNVNWVNTDKLNPSDSYVITVGGNDKCVFQWKNISALDAKVEKRPTSSEPQASHDSLDGLDEHIGGSELPSGGDEFMAVKPYLGAIVTPTAFAGSVVDKHKVDEYANAMVLMINIIKNKNDKDYYVTLRESARHVFDKLSESGVTSPAVPDQDELELEYVYGYRGFDTRNNVRYISMHHAGVKTRKILYHAAALGVVMDPCDASKRKKQSYFRGHTDDIMSIAVMSRVLADGKVQTLVATGQQGAANTFVWDAATRQTLATLQTKQKSINAIAFSCSGRFLVTISEDKQVVVSDWAGNRVLASDKGDPATTFHVACGNDAENTFSFLAVGDKFLRMYTLNGRNLTSTKITTSGAPGGTVQLFLTCVVFNKGNSYCVGCEDGSLYIFNADAKSVKTRKIHYKQSNLKDKTGSVTALYVDEEHSLLVSGAKDGSLVFWQIEGDSLTRFPDSVKIDEYYSDVTGKQIQSVSVFFETEDRALVLVGTRGCEMLELELTNFKDPKVAVEVKLHEVLMNGHCNDELWGLATHPLGTEFCTVGDDKTLKFWDAKSRNMKGSVCLGGMSRACAYHPLGVVVAVGYGGRVGRTNVGTKAKVDGMVRVYSSSRINGEYSKLAEAQESKQWVSDIKFTPDGRILAVGAHDTCIQLYDITLTRADRSNLDGTEEAGTPLSVVLKIRCKFPKHNSYISHFDFSTDSRFMQSNCGAYELLFSDVSTGKQITSATELKDVKWDTWTCTLGWPVQGIWGKGMDGGDINSACRSHSGHLLATSEDTGLVRVFRYPCIADGAQSLALSGHSSHVVCVRWTCGDKYLISVGGNDKTIMQWRHTMLEGNKTSSSNLDDDDDGGESQDVVKEGVTVGAVVTGAAKGAADDELPSGGDENMAVKPWVGAVRPPKTLPTINPAPPANKLSLKWVHGYTSAAAGNNGNVRVGSNLFYNAAFDPVYPAAALGVRFVRGRGEAGAASGTAPSSGNSQVYFQGHSDDILCLAISPNRRFVATGQTASHESKGKGSVCVWDAQECCLLSRMDGCHDRAVVQVAFSPDGLMLLTVGQDNNYTHKLWKDAGGNWSRVELFATEKSDQNPVLFTRWTQLQNTEIDSQFVSGGAQAIHFWKLEGSSLSRKQGRFGTNNKQQPLICAANLQTKGGWVMVVGTSGGDIYAFNEKKEVDDKRKVVKAHTGAVVSMAEGGKKCMFLVSGGKDGIVKLWTQDLQPMSSFDVTRHVAIEKTIGAIDVRPTYEEISMGPTSGNAGEDASLRLLIGTYGGEIIELSSTNKAVRNETNGETRNLDISNETASATILLHSHYSGELWGLAVHPHDPDIIATVGDDSTLRIWSIQKNAMLRAEQVGWASRSVAWHPSGGVLAVGLYETVKGGLAKGGASKGGKKGPAKPVDTAEALPNGAVHIYSIKIAYQNGSPMVLDVKRRASGCPSVAWIQEIKFSPSGDMLAAGSHDKKIYAYDLKPFIVPEEYWDQTYKETYKDQQQPASSGVVKEEDKWKDWESSLKSEHFVFNKHSSAILHFDFSIDGKYMQSNCQAYELLFLTTRKYITENKKEMKPGDQETSASKFADYNAPLSSKEDSSGWFSQTCKLGWPVVGIWAPGAGSGDVNSVDRDSSGKLLATADDNGQVKIFRYPVAQDNSKFLSYGGHSSHVTNVRFTSGIHSKTGHKNLVSVGGNDKCMFVWEVEDI